MWLDLHNIKLDRPSRKFAEKYAQYHVTEVIKTHAYHLDTPGEGHNVFHASLLKPDPQNPLPSQVQDDVQPPPIIIENEEEYFIEAIINERRRRGRSQGGPLRHKYLVKWRGYSTPTWTNASDLIDNHAIDAWEARRQDDSGTLLGSGSVGGE